MLIIIKLNYDDIILYFWSFYFIEHIELVQSGSTKFASPIEDINSWEIDFPFTISKKELDSLKTQLPFLGKQFRDKNGHIHFETAFGKAKYEEIESFHVTDVACKKSQDLTATVTKKS